MAAKFAIHGIPMPMSIVLDRCSDFIISSSRSTYFNCCEHGFTSHLTQLDDVWMHITKQYHARIVTMMSILIAHDIDVQVVSILKHITVWYAVRDHIVNRSAHRFWKLVKPNCRRVRLISHNVIMHNLINVVKTHANFGCIECSLQCSCTQVGSFS